VYRLTDQKGDEIMAGWPTGCRVRTTIDLSEMAHDVSAVKFCTTLSSLWYMNSRCRARKHVADARTTADIHKTRDLFGLSYLTNSSTENECGVRELVCGRTSTPLGSYSTEEISVTFRTHESQTNVTTKTFTSVYLK